MRLFEREKVGLKNDRFLLLPGDAVECPVLGDFLAYEWPCVPLMTSDELHRCRGCPNGAENREFPSAGPTGNFYQSGYFNKDTY